MFANATLKICLLGALLIAMQMGVAVAEDVPAETIDLTVRSGSDDSQRVSTSMATIAGMTVLTLLPALLVMCTSFTRIIIVLGFLRQALSIQQTPPNMVLTGMALFMTLFIMAPVFNRMHNEAVNPYLENKIDAKTAYDRGVKPLRTFMGQQTRKKDLMLMLDLSKATPPSSFEDVPTTTLVPAFVLSELRTAFQMGFLLFLPFMVIDLVVAAVLMSLGMMMVPPASISLPLKLLLFVLVDGWYLIFKSLAVSFSASMGV